MATAGEDDDGPGPLGFLAEPPLDLRDVVVQRDPYGVLQRAA
ncbi:hypothetical protein [Streptomyces mirabilis]